VAKIALALVVFVLVVHGLIHLMGTAVYLRLAEVKGLTYKTTLLSGHWELGENGIRVFGALWILPTIGFVAAALALAIGRGWWQPVLLWTTLLSLALTGLDWRNAFMGAITDTAILVLLWLRPHNADWFS